MWMNEGDINDVLPLLDQIEQREGWEQGQEVIYPYLRKAGETLVRYMRWVNSNSDGWAYWTRGTKPAEKLQGALRDLRSDYVRDQMKDLTPGEFTRLLTPIKSFLTKQGVKWQDVLDPPMPDALALARIEVLNRVLLELDQTEQAFKDGGNEGTPADFAADIVRVLGRDYLGTE